MILIVAAADDRFALRTESRLVERGESVVLVDTSLLRAELQLAWEPPGAAGWFAVGTCRYPVSQLRAVFDRSRPGSEALAPPAPECELVHAEWSAALLGLWARADRVVNSPTAAFLASAFLPAASSLPSTWPLRWPRTVLAIDVAAALRCLDREPGDLLARSTDGRILLHARDDEGRRALLSEIARQPLWIQALPSGPEARVFVVGNRVLPRARRSTGGGDVAPGRISEYLCDACRALARQIGLDFAEVFLVLDEMGGATCLDVNPFPYLDSHGEAVDETLVTALADFLSGAAA